MKAARAPYDTPSSWYIRKQNKREGKKGGKGEKGEKEKEKEKKNRPTFRRPSSALHAVCP